MQMKNEEMRAPDCGVVRDRLPLAVAGALADGEASEVRAHLEDCAACRSEAVLVKRLSAARPEPPAALVANVMARLDETAVPHREPRRAAWALSAAAVAVLALGVGVFGTADSGQDSLWSVALDHPSTAWQGEAWVVAGEPVLEALSDDVLRSLLRELEE